MIIDDYDMREVPAAHAKSSRKSVCAGISCCPDGSRQAQAQVRASDNGGWVEHSTRTLAHAPNLDPKLDSVELASLGFGCDGTQLSSSIL